MKRVKSIEERLADYESALKVLYTWTGIKGALIPQHVQSLCEKALNIPEERVDRISKGTIVNVNFGYYPVDYFGLSLKINVDDGSSIYDFIGFSVDKSLSTKHEQSLCLSAMRKLYFLLNKTNVNELINKKVSIIWNEDERLDNPNMKSWCIINESLD